MLQFLPSRLTFPQIGEHLFLSRSTIKTHAMAIYRKLGASSRDDAVATRARAGAGRARGAGLTTPPAQRRSATWSHPPGTMPWVVLSACM